MNKLSSENDFLNVFIYRTEKGDTVLRIADKFHTVASLLIYLNRLECEPEEGRLLMISVPSGNIYVVSAGETLSSIAQESPDRKAEIASINKIDGVFVGQKIIIPR